MSNEDDLSNVYSTLTSSCSVSGKTQFGKVESYYEAVSKETESNETESEKAKSLKDNVQEVRARID